MDGIAVLHNGMGLSNIRSRRARRIRGSAICLAKSTRRGGAHHWSKSAPRIPVCTIARTEVRGAIAPGDRHA